MSRHYKPDPRSKHIAENINRSLADLRRGQPFRYVQKAQHADRSALQQYK